MLCLQVQQPKTTELYSNFIFLYATSLKGKQFITPVPVYKTKYLFRGQYSNRQGIKFIDTVGMLKKLVDRYKLGSFFAEIYCQNSVVNAAFTTSASAKVLLTRIKR